nr:unnamed protein product [Spirometra erinaceieuropaei]
MRPAAASGCPPPPPPDIPSSISASTKHINMAHNPNTSTNTKTITDDTRNEDQATPVLTTTAPPPHTPAWSVTCKSSAQSLANQCLEHQTTPATPVSTAHTVLAQTCTAWAYFATSASVKTCGRQPPAEAHHDILPHHHLSTHQHHPPQEPNCHLPRKWEVCGSCRMGDSSLRLSRRVKHRGLEGY